MKNPYENMPPDQHYTLVIIILFIILGLLSSML
jgi:hypothetical protein